MDRNALSQLPTVALIEFLVLWGIHTTTQSERGDAESSSTMNGPPAPALQASRPRRQHVLRRRDAVVPCNESQRKDLSPFHSSNINSKTTCPPFL